MEKQNKMLLYISYRFLVLTVILLGSFGLSNIFAKEAVLYGGGPLYSDADTHQDMIRSSRFTTIVLWTIHVYEDGDLVLNDQKIIDDGVYVGLVDWPDELAVFKTGTTSVQRIEIAIGSWGVPDFENIESLIDAEGTGPGSTLYDNFLALENAVPAIDAVSFDDESNYDVDSSTDLAVMLSNLGYQVTLCPYTNSTFWSSVYSNVESQRPGTIDRIDLQCYAGGAGNNPDTWNNYFSGLDVTPGLWCYPNGQTPSEVYSQMNSWDASYGIAGGFMWLLDDMLAYQGTYPVAAYGDAINQALTSQNIPGTVAYWRFEAGPANTDVAHAGSGGVFSPDVLDVSGNGNSLSAWETGGGAGYQYRSDVGLPTVPLTGETNNLSVKNTGGYPAMWCNTLQSWEPAAFTIEATFKLEDGGYRTIIGRDSYGAAATNEQLAALYFQATPGNALAIKFCDVEGYWHDAVSAEGVFTSFNYGTNPNGVGVPWYSMAAVSDGSTLSLYLLEHGSSQGYQLIAETDMTTSGSPDTTLTSGAGDGGDWDAGDFSVGRGLYNGGHTDRAWGFIDEVRISDAALSPSEFLFSTDYQDTVAYWRFEEGPADSTVAHGGLGAGEFYPGVSDVSCKGNNLSVWSDTLGAHIYRNDIPTSPVSLTDQDNNFSVQNADADPGMFTSSADAEPDSLILDIETWQPEIFTIEASFKPESGSHRTIVGRDGQNVATQNGALAALYFQIQPDDSVAIKFADVSGYWHEAVSDAGVIQYDGSGHWYHMAAVCDAYSLKLYLNDVDAALGYQLVAETDMTASGSPDTRLVADTSSGSDWHGGGWSVGRGLFNGGHVDRLLGYIDEVRISSVALDPNEFLFYEAQYAGVVATPVELIIHEEGPTGDDLFFSLDSLPAGDVVLMIHEQKGRGQVTLDQTMLTFTPGNWNIPQPIHITAVDDLDLENAEHEVPLSVTVSSVLDADYDGLEVMPVIVKVADNECGAWGYAAGDFNMDCFVNFYDFASFAQGWMDCSDPDQAGCTDFSSF